MSRGGESPGVGERTDGGAYAEWLRVFKVHSCSLQARCK